MCAKGISNNHPHSFKYPQICDLRELKTGLGSAERTLLTGIWQLVSTQISHGRLLLIPNGVPMIKWF